MYILDDDHDDNDYDDNDDDDDDVGVYIDLDDSGVADLETPENCDCAAEKITKTSENLYRINNIQGKGAYCKVPKFSDARQLCCKLPKIQTKRPNHRIFCSKDANGIANSEDPDQTAPLGAVWSGSALFAKTYPSEK